MFVLTKIFGEYPQVIILDAFAEHFGEELSIPDLVWLTGIPETNVYNCVNRLLNEKILLEGNKVGFYRLDNEKQEAQLVVSLVNYIVSEKLSEKLEERGLEPLNDKTGE